MQLSFQGKDHDKNISVLYIDVVIDYIEKYSQEIYMNRT